MLLAAQGVPRAIGMAILIVGTLGWILYMLFNLRRAAPEHGSEVELAPNRKPYYEDEELEGPRLERVQLMGFGLLVVIGLGLPLYWLNEPRRSEVAIEKFDARFASWGQQVFVEFGCNGCHGGEKAVGGVAAYTVTDPQTGEISAVQWKAPALDTVMLRYREEEVRQILVYGRPFSPMSAWGLEGGGPMNTQQIQVIIEYLKSIQKCDWESEGLCQAANDVVTEEAQKAYDAEMKKFAAGQRDTEPTMGEVLFNLEVASGSYSCARCHTRGWSYGDPQQAGSGAYGPSLVGGVTPNHFPREQDHIDFVTEPPGTGKKYGEQNQQFKPMPGFGKLLTQEQIEAIVEYERGL